jgi:preprotein translocase subunit SecD
LRTIIDSNVTTIIAAIVIAIFGVGTVKGFGYTLIISIVVSMFTAIVITRWLLRFIIYLNIKNRKLYTIKKQIAESFAKGGE